MNKIKTFVVIVLFVLSNCSISYQYYADGNEQVNTTIGYREGRVIGAAAVITGVVFPVVSTVIGEGIKKKLFGAKETLYTLDDVTNELSKIENSLKDIKEAIEYQDTFKKDDRNDDKVKHLQISYKQYEAMPDSKINQDQLKTACKEVDTGVILDFYDRQLVDRGPRTLGNLIFSTWNKDKLNEWDNLYYLKITRASLLYGACIAYQYGDDMDLVNNTLYSQNGHLKGINSALLRFQDDIEARLAKIDKEFFALAKKELEDMDLVKVGTSVDHICPKFYEHLSTKYGHLDWVCAASRFQGKRGLLYADAYAEVNSMVFIVEATMISKATVVFVGASKRNSGNEKHLYKTLDNCVKDEWIGIHEEPKYFFKTIFDKVKNCQELKDIGMGGAFVTWDDAELSLIHKDSDYWWTKCFPNYVFPGVTGTNKCYKVALNLP